jgi:FAD/FMN-containing dehydrogenase
MKRRTFLAGAFGAAASASVSWRARAAIPDELPVLSRTGKALRLTRAEVSELATALRGKLLLAGDDGYESARKIWNGAFDRRPAAIARCAGAADVVRAVQFAASHDLLVAVRGGGHSLPGHSVCEGGFMIDLAPMQGVRVDPQARTARVDPGVLLGAMDREAQAFGLVVPAGTVSHTGVAGLTLGGGFGRLTRKFGLTIDNLLSADLVTADGRLLRASSLENPDLFWALRGGGGNFGVVTSFEFRAHELEGNVVGGNLDFPFDQARSILRAVVEISARASDDFWIDPVIEGSADGGRRLRVDVCHCGEARVAERDIGEIRALGKLIHDDVGARPYTFLQSRHDGDSPHGRSYYMSGGLVQSVEPAMIDHAVERMKHPSANLGKISITQHGGAIARVPVDATAFANRSASHNVVLRAAWDDPGSAPAGTAWQKDTWKGIAPFTSGTYANLNLKEADPRVVGAYGPNLERLTEIKTRFDPKNLFHLNPNIKPRSAPPG